MIPRSAFTDGRADLPMAGESAEYATGHRIGRMTAGAAARDFLLFMGDGSRCPRCAEMPGMDCSRSGVNASHEKRCSMPRASCRDRHSVSPAPSISRTDRDESQTSRERNCSAHSGVAK